MNRPLGLVSLVTGAMVATAVSAQPPPVQRRQVVLESTASLPAVAFEGSLRELLGRLSLAVVSPGRADPRAILALVRIDATAGGVLVTVRRGSDGAPFVQRDVPAAGSDAILAETVAYVILGAVEPLTQVSPEPPPSAPPPSAPPAASSSSAPTSPAPVAPPGPRLGWEAGARFVGRRLAGDADTTGLGLHGGLTLPWRWRPSLTLDASRLWTMHRAFDSIEASVDTLSLRALVRMDILSGPRASLSPAVGVGLDRLALTPRSGPSDVRLAAATSRVQPVLTAAIEGRVWLTSWLAAVASLGLDVDTAPRRWVVQNEQLRGAFFTPGVVRPSVTLGLDVGRATVVP